MNKYKKLLLNTVILAFGTIGSKILVLLLMRFYTACLSPTEFGLAEILSQTANLLIPLAALGLYKGIFRYVTDGLEDKRAVLSTGFLLLLFGFAGFLVLSPLLGLFSQFEGLAWVIVPYVICAGLHSVLAEYLRAEGRTVLFAVQGICNTILTIGLNILFLLGFSWTTLGYVLSVVIADFCISVALFIVGRFWRVISFRLFDKRLAGELLRFSLPMIPAIVLWWITDVSDRYFVTAICGEDVNGIYAVSYKIPTILTLISGIFGEAWQYSAIKEDTDPGEYRKFFGTVYSHLAAVAFCCASGLLWLCRWISFWMFAPEYAGAWQYIPLLLLATTFMTFDTFLGTIYLVRKKTMRTFLTALAAAAINLALNAWLIPLWGPQGAALATFAAYFVVFIIRLVDAWHYVRFNVQLVRTVINSLLLAGQTVILLYEVPHWFWYEAGLVVLTGLVNVKPMIDAVGGFIRSRRSRRVTAAEEKGSSDGNQEN